MAWTVQLGLKMIVSHLNIKFYSILFRYWMAIKASQTRIIKQNYLIIAVVSGTMISYLFFFCFWSFLSTKNEMKLFNACLEIDVKNTGSWETHLVRVFVITGDKFFVRLFTMARRAVGV